MLKLHQVMQEAGVLDVEKVRERITPVTTFESQAAWWLAEIAAGRIVNSRTRKPIRTNTTDAYSTAVTCLNGVVGNIALASLDNPLQHSRKGEIVPTLKTDAGFRDVDVLPLVATMLREHLGNRKSGFLSETETGNMLWPGTLYRDGLKTI